MSNGSLETPYFSVVIATYNRANLISTAINSVLRQTWPDLEVIVADDGSTDDTRSVVDAFSDPRVRYIHCHHGGTASARNAGARVAHGRFVIFLDSDDHADARWLAAIQTQLEGTGAALAWCGMEGHDITGKIQWRWAPTAIPDDLTDLLVHCESGQVAYRRDLFLRSGGFREDLEFAENTELGIRLLVSPKSRPSIVLVPEILVYVRTAGTDRDYRSLRAASARLQLEEYPGLRRKAPSLWSSYQAIVGADLMRQGRRPEARRSFRRAWITRPSKEHLGRLVASTLTSVATAAWPAENLAVPPAPTQGKQGHRIMFVALASGLGGSMRSLATLLEHLPGFYRVVACPGPSGFTELIDSTNCYESRLSLPHETVGRIRARINAAASIAAYAWAHRRVLVAIHANGLSERNLVAPASLLSGVRVVVWVHDWNVPPWSRRLSPLLRRFERGTTFVAVSEHAREMVVDAGLAPPERVIVIPNPVDPAQVCGPSRPGHDRPVGIIGYVGAPAAYKGFHLLPGLIRELEDEPLEWVIYSGPRTAMPEIWDELSRFPDSLVQLEDKVVDVSQAYERFDIVVCPSLHESFGRVAAEAMANGLPIVASDLPSLNNVLGGGQAGVLVPPGDIAGMAEAIRRLCRDPELRAQMGTAGRQLAARFSPDRIAPMMSSLYTGSSIAASRE